MRPRAAVIQESFSELFPSGTGSVWLYHSGVESQQALLQAEKALRLVQINLPKSTHLATETLELAKRAGFLSAASVAERALGLAALHREELHEAMRHLRSAIR